MASDVVARDMFMNIQFIKSWRTKYWWKLLEKETLYITLRPLAIEIMTKKNAPGGKLLKKSIEMVSTFPLLQYVDECT